MSVGLDNLKHIVVLMMENLSFDHMLAGLRAVDARINGLTGNETNPDTTGEPVKVQAQAEFQSQLDPDPDHHFPRGPQATLRRYGRASRRPRDAGALSKATGTSRTT